jgi:hypothetical protein
MMPDLTDTWDIASLRRQPPAQRNDPGREALVRLAMLLARQAAAETMQELVGVRSADSSPTENRTAARPHTAACTVRLGDCCANRAT